MADRNGAEDRTRLDLVRAQSTGRDYTEAPLDLQLVVRAFSALEAEARAAVMAGKLERTYKTVHSAHYTDAEEYDADSEPYEGDES